MLEIIDGNSELHDMHVAHDVGRIGELKSDLGNGTADGAHGVRDDVHSPPCHTAVIQTPQRLLHFLRISPVISGAGVFFLLGTDEGEILHAGHVSGIGAAVEAIGALGLIELDIGSRVDQEPAETIVLFG